jgi:hypothetical protein
VAETLQEEERSAGTMSKHYHIHWVCKTFLLAALWAIGLSGCNLRSVDIPSLRITNNGFVPIKNLVVLFPHDRIEFGDVPAGTTTDYKETSNGVFRYAAYQFEVDGQTVTEPAIDWIGESPMSGILFTYTIDYDPNRTDTGGRIQLIEVKNDD